MILKQIITQFVLGVTLTDDDFNTLKIDRNLLVVTD